MRLGKRAAAVVLVTGASLTSAVATAEAHHKPDVRHAVYHGDRAYSECSRDGQGGIRSELWDRYNCTRRNPSAVELWVHKR